MNTRCRMMGELLDDVRRFLPGRWRWVRPDGYIFWYYGLVRDEAPLIHLECVHIDEALSCEWMGWVRNPVDLYDTSQHQKTDSDHLTVLRLVYESWACEQRRNETAQQDLETPCHTAPEMKNDAKSRREAKSS